MTGSPSAISKVSCDCSRGVGASRWNYSTGKRLLDLAASLFVLLIILPLILLIALAVKLNSRGPVFFRQERVGKDRKLFTLIKFRSMVWASQPGPGLTCYGDRRVTVVGRVLRNWKLDELPQFTAKISEARVMRYHLVWITRYGITSIITKYRIASIMRQYGEDQRWDDEAEEYIIAPPEP
jgi:lipopolysaccharide/colanic/teichoic acid biosynthesis glycosyltransferase